MTALPGDDDLSAALIAAIEEVKVDHFTRIINHTTAHTFASVVLTSPDGKAWTRWTSPLTSPSFCIAKS